MKASSLRSESVPLDTQASIPDQVWVTRGVIFMHSLLNSAVEYEMSSVVWNTQLPVEHIGDHELGCRAPASPAMKDAFSSLFRTLSPPDILSRPARLLWAVGIDAVPLELGF